MLKYLYIVKIKMLHAYRYNLNTIVGLLFGNGSVLITILFWNLIYSNRNSINNFSLSDMVSYYLFAIIFRNFVLSQAGFEVNNLVHSGKLNTILLKPYDFMIMNYFNVVTDALGRVLPQIALTALLLPIFKHYLSFTSNTFNLFFLIIFILISTISSYLIWSLLGYMAFAIEQAQSVMWSFAVFFNFISGMFLPLTFFPTWLSRIIEYLPTAMWIDIPNRLIIGKLTIAEIYHYIVINLAWLIILYLINRWVWVKSIKKYSAVGG